MLTDLGRDLVTALCLMLIFEGMLPFISPQRWRLLVQWLAYTDDRTLRRVGLVSMVVGVLLLVWVR